jgi:hypothetical protein
VAGGFFAINAWMTLSIGTASRMGAGYFPIILGIALCLLGLAIVAKAFRSTFVAITAIPVRAIVMVGLAPTVFGLTVRGLGLVAALFLSVLVASLSSGRVSLPKALLVTTGITVFCVSVFYYGLGLPMDLFGPWLSGLGL